MTGLFLRRALVVASCATVAGCAMTPDMTQAPSVRTSTKDYQVVAACAYTALDRAYPTQIRLTNLPGANQARITHEIYTSGILTDATTRAFDMSIEKAPGGTRVSIYSFPTNPTSRTWGEISSCL